MTKAALIRAVGALIFTVIHFHAPFLHIALPLAGTVVTALEVYKLTRNSDVLRQKEVEDIVYWSNPKKTGIAIGIFSIALHIVCKYSIITVITYTLLFIFGAAASNRMLKNRTVANSRTTNAVYTFSEIIVQYLLLLQKMAPSSANSFVEKTICIYNFLLKLILAEKEWETVKFTMILFSLTYIVHWIAEFPFTMTILCFGASIIAKIYKDNQNTIDRHLATYSGCIENLQNLINKKRPFLSSAPIAAEKKKDK